MKTNLLAGAVVAGLMTLATSAYAVPIAAGSVLSLSGNDTYTPTSITFTNPANINAGTGSFTILGTPPQCSGCATMIATLTAATPLGSTLYAGHNLANTVTTDLITTSAPVFSFSLGPPQPNLTVTGFGTLDLTGFSPTSGFYTVTTQGPTGVSVSFSVTSQALATPEPASLAILGGALAGLGLLRRRRQKVA